MVFGFLYLHGFSFGTDSFIGIGLDIHFFLLLTIVSYFYCAISLYYFPPPRSRD